MALSSATPARSTGRDSIDPRQACEPCWTIDRRTTQATFTYLGDRYCEPCLRREGIAIEDAERIDLTPSQPESESPMATPATAPTLRLKPGRGQRFCKCNCGEICGTKFGYVPGHGPVEAEPRKTKRAGRATEETKLRARVLHSQGKSTRDIARELGVSHGTAHRWVAEKSAARKPYTRKSKPVAFAEPFHAPGVTGLTVDLTRVDVKVTPTWLDQWFSQLPIANKVAIFNAQSEL